MAGAAVMTVDQMRALLADRLVVADIQCNGLAVRSEGATLWDCRHMVDPREHCAEFIDMARIAIAYAVATGLAVVDDPAQPFMLRLDARRLEALDV